MTSIRPIVPEDRDAFQAFVKGLSPEARTNRFFYPVRELGPAALDALVKADQSRHVGLVAVEGDEIVGEGRYVTHDDGRHGEFALAVADRWQRRGLGRRLMDTLVGAAQRAGLAALEGDVLRTNAAMLEFVRRAGFRLRLSPGDARLTIAERTLA
jgi:acetyltransferase